MKKKYSLKIKPKKYVKGHGIFVAILPRLLEIENERDFSLDLKSRTEYEETKKKLSPDTSQEKSTKKKS
jgi:hypothetical protein